MNNKNDVDKKQDSNVKSSHLSYGVSFGLIGGAAFAIVFGSLFEFPLIWALGPGFGLLIGIIISSIMNSKENKG